jgi:hypothetical protein
MSAIRGVSASFSSSLDHFLFLVLIKKQNFFEGVESIPKGLKSAGVAVYFPAASIENRQG